MDQGETKKRKMILEEEEDDEDVKIETFFALIRSTKDIRDRMLGSHALIQPPKPPAAVTASTEVVNWQPSFQVEDFGDKSNGGVLKLADLNTTAYHQAAGGGCGGRGGDIGGGSPTRSEENSDIVKPHHSNNNHSRIALELDLNLSL